MAMNPRIEEVSDSDSDSDPSDMDPSDFDPSTSIIAPSSIPSTATSAAANPASSDPQASAAAYAAARKQQEAAQAVARERAKHYQCLYPIYFDASRSRHDGRRVAKSQAVVNPLARGIVDALQSIGIPGAQIVFEPSKTHPRDWANPGRVKVELRRRPDGEGARGADATGGRVRNKLDLLAQVGAYLVQHPTTPDSPLKLRVAGLPPPKDGQVPIPVVPRGFKIGSVLPLHSPALSGGGVNEDFFKDMMKEMGAGGALEGNPMAQMANMMGGFGGGAGAGGGGAPKQQRIRVGGKKGK